MHTLYRSLRNKTKHQNTSVNEGLQSLATICLILIAGALMTAQSLPLYLPDACPCHSALLHAAKVQHVLVLLDEDRGAARPEGALDDLVLLLGILHEWRPVFLQLVRLQL